jgi:exodeoxyribonuclease V beta subunit
VLGLFYKLKAELTRSGFACFFDRLLNSRWKEKTLLEELLQREDGPEFYLALQQIAGLLLENQQSFHLSSDALLAFFEELKILDANGDERLLLQQGEEDAVNILTLHVSKGLQFDVVFAIGLANRDKEREELVLSKKDGSDVLIACDRESDLLRMHYSELDAEKMRQLYVGMTRAKFRLYVPVALHVKSKPLAFGTASPMDLFLARLGKDKVVSEQELYARIEAEQGESLREYIQVSDATASFLNEESIELQKLEIAAESCELFIPSEITPKWAPLYTTSFTGMAPEVEKPKQQLSPPSDWSAEEKSIHTLPAGSATGVLLHTLFEEFPYKRAHEMLSVADCLSIIEPLIKEPQALEWKQVLAEMVFDALRAPLLQGSDAFCLADVAPERMSCEMEFLFPSAEGFIKGFIDLVFEHNGKYYILDWKSNWLGSSSDDYSHERLHQSMLEHHYLLQAEIYTSALEKYLSVMSECPFSNCFGGAFYLFLRGVGGKESGIYHIT